MSMYTPCPNETFWEQPVLSSLCMRWQNAIKHIVSLEGDSGIVISQLYTCICPNLVLPNSR